MLAAVMAFPSLKVVFASTLLLACSCSLAAGYLPVIVLHGIFSDAAEMKDLVQLITTAHPGTQVYNIDGYDKLSSVTENMWKQVYSFQKKMLPIFQNSTEGVNMICFSQGGLVCRAILQITPQHNVKTFVSLSSPQGGQYGDTVYLNASFMLPNFTKEHMYLFFYSELGQDITFGNYWKDPHHLDSYRKQCDFLPKLEAPSNSSYRENFLKIKELVLIGGPDDGVITPWQSSQFATYNDSEKVLELQYQDYYLNDSFGLKTLNSQGRLHIHTVAGVHHTEWHGHRDTFKCCIEPYLN